jgi:hypothetical protein
VHPLTADPATVRGDRGLAYTLDPRVLYRGYFANTLNMGLGTGFQFLVNGSVKQMMTGSEHRQLSPSEQLSAGFVAGSTSALLISPTELLMIQQQRKGGGIIGAAGIVLGTSPATALRGMLTTGNSSSARPLLCHHILCEWRRCHSVPSLMRELHCAALIHVLLILLCGGDSMQQCGKGSIPQAILGSGRRCVSTSWRSTVRSLACKKRPTTKLMMITSKFKSLCTNSSFH